MSRYWWLWSYTFSKKDCYSEIRWSWNRQCCRSYRLKTVRSVAGSRITRAGCLSPWIVYRDSLLVRHQCYFGYLPSLGSNLRSNDNNLSDYEFRILNDLFLKWTAILLTGLQKKLLYYMQYLKFLQRQLVADSYS